MLDNIWISFDFKIIFLKTQLYNQANTAMLINKAILFDIELIDKDINWTSYRYRELKQESYYGKTSLEIMKRVKAIFESWSNLEKLKFVKINYLKYIFNRVSKMPERLCG